MNSSQKILLLDNNDSFTFNIVELIRSLGYSKLKVISSNSIIIKEIKTFDKIIISPGPGLPKDFPILEKTIKEFAGKKPIFGICLGHQAICQYYGADLLNLKDVVHGQPKVITIIKDSKLLENFPSQFNVGLYHSWFVAKKDFPKQLEITSISENNRIMSIEHKSLPIFGVQFHPESFITEYGAELMNNFLIL